MGSLRWCPLLLACALAGCGSSAREARADEPPLLLADPDDCHCSLTTEDRAAAPAPGPAPAPKESAAPEPQPDAATIARRYSDEPTSGPPVWTGRRIDLDLVDADLHNVFRLLSEAADLDIVVTDDVRGTITLRLDDVPWDQALDAVVRSEGLAVARNGRVLVIRRPVTP